MKVKFDEAAVRSAQEVKAVRDIDLKGLIIDVAERDDEKNILVYIPPNKNPKKYEDMIKMACIDVFGHDPGDKIECLFYKKDRQIGLGTDLKPCDSFCIIIKSPLSMYHSLETVKDEFTRRLFKHLTEQEN
jgi:hypothetical protein